MYVLSIQGFDLLSVNAAHLGLRPRDPVWFEGSQQVLAANVAEKECRQRLAEPSRAKKRGRPAASWPGTPYKAA